jgi:hypothetical protein
MTYPVTVTLREDFLGASTVEGEFRAGKHYAPPSRVFICPFCGDAWAKYRVEGQPYFIFCRGCDKCGDAHSLDIGGSLWIDWEAEYQKSLPHDALMREVILYCNRWQAAHSTEE